MSKVHSYSAGPFDLMPKQLASYFWDIPEYPGNSFCTWNVTAVPEAVLDGETLPEQRVEVIEVFLLRKGPNAAEHGANRLQLNYKIRNIGENSAKGNVVISAVEVTK